MNSRRLLSACRSTFGRARALSRRGLAGGPRLALRRAGILARMALGLRFSELRYLWQNAGIAPSTPAAVGLVEQPFPLMRPLVVFPEPGPARRRLTLLTDSISAGSLFGGVGTAIILAALLARRLDCALRVVTRMEPPNPSNFGEILRVHGIRHESNVEFLQSGIHADARGLPMTGQDLVLSTSWWTTRAALSAVPASRIIYLLQEDERMFYPAGDEQLRCAEVLGNPDIQFVINSQLLHRHFAADGLEAIATRGLAFEPAFPTAIYHPGERGQGGKRRFFFYARPNNPRNLFWRGIESIFAAIERGVLPPEEWEFDFVGKDIPHIELPLGARLRTRENLPWAEYAALVRSADVGLSLMYTPHPSYPPLDLAASGAVVVTNRYGIKTSLEMYSRNILCVEPEVDALVAGIAQAAGMARDAAAQAGHAADSGIARDWEASFGPVIERLAAGPRSGGT